MRKIFRIMKVTLAMVLTISCLMVSFPVCQVYGSDADTMFYNEMLLHALVNNRHFVIDTLTTDSYPYDNPNAAINGIFDGLDNGLSRDFHYIEVLNELTGISSRSGFAILVYYKYLGNQISDVGAQIIEDSFNEYSREIDAVMKCFPGMVLVDLVKLTTEQLCEALSVTLSNENQAEYDELCGVLRKIGAVIQYVENAIMNYESPSESQYAAILNHALTTNYTSSIGNSTNYEQVEMEMSDQLENFLEFSIDIPISDSDKELTLDLPKIGGYIKNIGGYINEAVMSDHADKYTRMLFSNQINTAESYLSCFSSLVQYDLEHSSLNSGNNSRFAIQSQKAIQTLMNDGEYEYLATEQAWRNHIIGLTNAETGEIYNKEYKKYYDRYKDINDFMSSFESAYKLINKGLSFGKKTIENINYFETLYKNYASMHGIMERAVACVGKGNDHISDAINSIIADMEMVNENGENILLLSMIDVLVDTIAKNDKDIASGNILTVNQYGDFVKKTISESAVDSLVKVISKQKNLNPIATRAALSTAVKRIGGAVSMGVLLGDIVFNASDIVDKYVELMYINDIIQLFEDLYHEDYFTYLTSKIDGADANERDRLAQIVLDDLELLKILKCRAESLSFDVDISALNCRGNQIFELIYGAVTDDPSYVGKRKAELEAQKKSHIDALVDTLINPYSTPQITLTSGQRLHITEINGDIWLEIYNANAGGMPVAVKAEGQYALRGIVTANDAQILVNGNIYIGTLSLKNSSLTISGNTDTVGIYGLDLSGKSKINTINNSNTPLVDVSYASISGTADISAVDFWVTENLFINSAAITGSIINYGNYSGTGTSSLSSLIIEGDLTTQYSGGTLNLQNISVVNTASRGIYLDNITLNVSGSLKNLYTYIINGKNINALSTASFADDYFHSDVTLKDLSIQSDMTFGGTIYTNGTITLGGDKLIVGGIQQQNGTLTISASECIVYGGYKNTTSSPFTLNKGCNMTVKGDMDFGSATSTLNGSVTLGGDLIANSGNVTIQSLELNGRLGQDITSTSSSVYTMKVGDLSIINKSLRGVRVSNNIIVSSQLSNDGRIAKNGERITLAAGGTLIGDSYYGNLTLESAVITNAFSLNGNLTVKKGLTVSGDLKVTGNLIHETGAMNVSGFGNIIVGKMVTGGTGTGKTMLVETDARIDVRGIANLNGYTTTTIDGTAIYNSDLQTSGTVSGAGTISVGGDLMVTGTFNQPAHVILTSSVPQIVSGGTLNFRDLTVHNTSVYGIRFESKANVYGNQTINANRIVKEENLIQKAG